MPARRPLLLAVLLAAALSAAPGAARDKKKEKDKVEELGAHHFGIVGHRAADGGEAALQALLDDAKDDKLDFLVVTGIKGAAEPCGDRVYQKRRDLFDKAKRPVILSITGSDWTGCRNSLGRTNAIERLNRLRELFYGEPESLGKEKLLVSRLSSSPRFRSYAENAHWQVGKVLYATINLPAANNNYLPAAGRNSEYEDRAVANRFWLNRLFAIAKQDKVDAVVLFGEGNMQPLLQPANGLRALLQRTPTGHDGFANTRRQVQQQAAKFKGQVLVVDSAGLPKESKPAIEWRGNLGHLSVGTHAVEVRVAGKGEKVFVLGEGLR
ncbi:hypothetical protein [Massilia yuzhufengensis]|uniref:Uncharacterized protein n=1 Tax=Massilia yuzhufengensis TaxID=1164594 RepID=A0A1I1V7R0_9BURK|nr:hypothetical protein [Massilia yuzhufengensis]SFD78909.1 hypothetical protein SAMN05216204_1382 [Massilia yuzhufengensis]